MMNISDQEIQYLNTTNFISIMNLLAIVFFSFALVFDLYKWYPHNINDDVCMYRCTFLAATSTFISQKEDLYKRSMYKLKIALITVQLMIAIAASVIMILLLVNKQN
jgi:hypothetical protein